MLLELRNKFKDNLLINKYYYSYQDDSWILEMNGEEINVEDNKEEKNDCDKEKEAIKYYIDNPIKIKKVTDVMINKDLIFRRSLIEFDEKDIEHIYKYDDINIYIRKSIDENDKNKVTLDDDYLKLNRCGTTRI